MRPSARTPEELETLFEDACVLRDRNALATPQPRFRAGSIVLDRRHP